MTLQTSYAIFIPQRSQYLFHWLNSRLNQFNFAILIVIVTVIIIIIVIIIVIVIVITFVLFHPRSLLSCWFCNFICGCLRCRMMEIIDVSNLPNHIPEVLLSTTNVHNFSCFKIIMKIITVSGRRWDHLLFFNYNFSSTGAHTKLELNYCILQWAEQWRNLIKNFSDYNSSLIYFEVFN